MYNNDNKNSYKKEKKKQEKKAIVKLGLFFFSFKVVSFLFSNCSYTLFLKECTEVRVLK